MNEILKIIFGDYTLLQLFSFGWFFLVGYIIYGLNETNDRDKNSITTPEKWNWKFWVSDNWKRYLVTILTTYVFFRFYVMFIGHEFTEFEAVMMGLIGDGVGATAKKKVDAVKADREKLMNNIDNNIN